MLKRGDQVVYIPAHAKKNIEHEDVEYGFVTSVSKNVHLGTVYCRFWSVSSPDELRTKANSEACNLESLTLHDSKPQEEVVSLLAAIDKAELFGQGVKQ